jgi:hypothetical protein
MTLNWSDPDTRDPLRHRHENDKLVLKMLIHTYVTIQDPFKPSSHFLSYFVEVRLVCTMQLLMSQHAPRIRSGNQIDHH